MKVHFTFQWQNFENILYLLMLPPCSHKRERSPLKFARKDDGCKKFLHRSKGIRGDASNRKKILKFNTAKLF